jgi:hypothetical protein
MWQFADQIGKCFSAAEAPAALSLLVYDVSPALLNGALLASSVLNLGGIFWSTYLLALGANEKI